MSALTLEQMRNCLFLKQSSYHSWSRKDRGVPNDPFLTEIFCFLTNYQETIQAYNLIVDTGTSHSDFCNGRLRSDGYYPLRSINEKIYYIIYDSMTDCLDNASVIKDIAEGFTHLKDDFATELQANNPVFELISFETCYNSPLLFKHLQELLNSNQFFIVLAWMTIIAIFPIPKNTSKKKPNYTDLLLKNIFHHNLSESKNINTISLHEAVDQLIIEKLKLEDELEEFNLAFNHGIRWITNGERNQLLYQLIERSKHINIMITEYQIAKNFNKHLLNPNYCYVSDYVSPQKIWVDLCRKYPEKITLKISTIPVLRQYMELRFQQAEHSALYVGFYIYGGHPFNQSHFLILQHGAPYYCLYRDEFQYLWRLASDASDCK